MKQMKTSGMHGVYFKHLKKKNKKTHIGVLLVRLRKHLNTKMKDDPKQLQKPKPQNKARLGHLRESVNKARLGNCLYFPESV